MPSRCEKTRHMASKKNQIRFLEFRVQTFAYFGSTSKANPSLSKTRLNMKLKNRIPIVLLVATLIQMPLSAADLFGVQSDSPKAQAGEYVLCPSRAFVDSAIEKGVDRTTFIYYAAKMIKVGAEESTVKNLAGREFPVPNELIVSIPPNQTASVGDVLLTWWQSGSGMQRAIVVGGSAGEPVVRYLDVALDNPSGIGTKEEMLKRNSFFVLDQPLEIGSTAVITTSSQKRFGQIVMINDKHVLVREFAGKIKRYERNQLSPIPITPKLDPSSNAYAAIFGTMRPVTVKRVDQRNGRVHATYQFGRTEKSKAFSFGEILAMPQ